MKKILITRKLIKSSEEFAKKNFEVQLNQKDSILSKEEIIKKSQGCDGILSSITDKFDSDLILNLPNTIKIISNFAVGFGNIDRSGRIYQSTTSSSSFGSEIGCNFPGC